MRKYIFTFLLLLSCQGLFAQTPLWVLNFGSATDNSGKVCKVAPNGNVCIAGKFTGTIDLDPGAGIYNITSNGQSDIFLACYTASGVFLWGFGIGGPGYDGAWYMNIDQFNNIVICGYFQSSGIDFDPGAGTTILPYAGGTGSTVEGDGFVAKFTSAGTLRWAKGLGGATVYDQAVSLGSDEVGDIYVGGVFNTSMTISPAITFSSAVSGTAYLIKYDSVGNLVWGHNYGDPGIGSVDCFPRTLQVSHGYIYVGGIFQGTSNFYPWGTGATLTSASTYDGYLAKYDTACNLVFVKQITGSGSEDQLWSLALDPLDNIYALGSSVSPAVTFDATLPGSTTVTAPGGGGNDDILLAKYNSNGVYQWGSVIGGTGNDIGHCIDIANGNLYCTGGFQNTADMDPSAAVSNLTSHGSGDVFLTKYDLNGNYVCGFNIGSATDDAGYGVDHDALGNIYVAGQFGGTAVDFNPGTGTDAVTAISSLDAFLAKYNYSSAATITGTLKGDTSCAGAAHLTVTINSGISGSFSVTYTDGATIYTQTGVTSGVPFVISPAPTATTTFTLTSITNGSTGICAAPSLSGFLPAVVVVLNNCCDMLSMPDSVHLCVGDTLTMKDTVTGGNTILSILWSPATGLSSTTVLHPLLTATTSGWYDLAVQSLIPTNLVVNGDFSAGNTGFTISSAYTLETLGVATSPGHYVVTTNPNLYNSSFPATGDHTTGTGNLLLIDASATAGSSIWCESLPVLANTDYIFSVWVELAAAPAPSVQVLINGLPVGTFTTVATSGIWSQFQVTWNSGTSTTANICMQDLSVVGNGNDFAIDDVSLQQVCKVKDSTYVDAKLPVITTMHKDTTVCADIPAVTLNAFPGYISYLWSTASTASSITVSSAGSYWVHDSSYCALMVDTFHVFFKPLPTVNLGNDTTICNGDSLILSSSQPLGSSYLWSTGSTADSIHVVTGGTYWLQVDSGCVFRDSIVVSFSPSPGVNLGPDTTNCLGQPVVLQSLISYGSGVSYVWNTGATTSTITAASSGVYWLQVNNTGCPGAVDSIHVNIFYDTVKLHTPDTAVCKGVSVQVLTTGAPSNTYQWVPTTGMAASNVGSPVIIADTSAEYILTASFPGCPDVKDSFYLDVQPSPVNVYIGGNRSVCAFDTLHIHATVTPAWYTHYHYSWTPATSLDNSTLPDVTFYAGDSTEIVLNVTTSAGCNGADSAMIDVFPGNFAHVDSVFNICPHDSVQLMPFGGVSYSWSPSIYLDDAHSATPWVHAITTQDYTLIATSQYGCRDTLSVLVTVRPAAVIYLPDSVTLYPGDFYQLNPQTNCTDFLWRPSIGLNTPYVSNPVATPDANTKYYVFGTTAYGCKTEDSISIFVDPQTTLQLPNAFTPGSGPNGLFKILKLGLANLNYFRIYNRWGNVVYESTNIDEGWDGTYKGKAQPFDVYVYEVEAVTSTGVLFHKQGNVTLIR